MESQSYNIGITVFTKPHKKFIEIAVEKGLLFQTCSQLTQIYFWEQDDIKKRKTRADSIYKLCREEWLEWHVTANLGTSLIISLKMDVKKKTLDNTLEQPIKVMNTILKRWEEYYLLGKQKKTKKSNPVINLK